MVLITLRVSGATKEKCVRFGLQPSNSPAHGAKPGHEDEQSIAAQGTATIVNWCIVNRSAPELFPVISLVKKWFTPRETEERGAFDWIGVDRSKSLNKHNFL